MEVGGAIAILGGIMAFLGRVIFRTNTECENVQTKCQKEVTKKLDAINVTLEEMEKSSDLFRKEAIQQFTVIAKHMGSVEQYMKDRE